MTNTFSPTNSMALVAAKSLPALSGESVTYNAEKNLFLTTGYTSAAGNTYYKILRVSDRLAVYCDLGQGYYYTFINSITLFCWDGPKAKVIAKKSWGGYDWRVYSESFVKEQSIQMLMEYLKGQAKALGQRVNEQDARAFALGMVEETTRKRLR